MTSRDELLEQIDILHEDDDHQTIIDEILKIPENERDYELTCLLARAYNNTEEFEKALSLLLSIEGEGRYDLMWHYRIGYAYYYMDMLEQAKIAFERVLESDPENDGALEFLKWIREELLEAAEIKPKQEEKALEQMIAYLSHEDKLGKPPFEIEKASEFALHGLHYYIYKYKKEKDEPWLLGACGGYGRLGLDHCGHIFSEQEEYNPDTAEEKAIVFIETFYELWMNEAEKELKKRGILSDLGEISGIQTGPFAGFVLLDSYDFDPGEIKSILKNDWNILAFEEESTNASDEKSLVFGVDGMMAAISFIEMPVPNGEAEHYAETNYIWPNAVETTKTHVAQIFLAAISGGKTAVDTGILFTKVASSCLKLKNAVGLYASGTVFQPEFYIDVAGLIDSGDLPILNWIYFGVYTNEKGTSGYTYGLRMFGKEEIEVINSTVMPESIYDFLIDIVYYILSEDITLEDGETIGFTEVQKLKIKRSKGVAVDGYTMKIEY